LMND